MDINFAISLLTAAVILCDENGIITFLNERAVKNYEKSGGKALIGTNVLDCHPEQARKKLETMMEHHTKNVYTIEKNGIKKLIYQEPLMEEGICRGFIEISLEIPFEMPHFVRK